MRDLLSRSDIRQRQDLQRVVVRRIRFIAVINEPEVAPNMDPIFPLPGELRVCTIKPAVFQS